MIERYIAYWVDLDPTRGSELSKRRPAVVISDDEMNASLIRTEVAGQTAEIACDQIRTVSRARLSERMGHIGEDAAAAVRHVITEMYGVLSVRTE